MAPVRSGGTLLDYVDLDRFVPRHPFRVATLVRLLREHEHDTSILQLDVAHGPMLCRRLQQCGYVRE
jgi:hypothetical protein